MPETVRRYISKYPFFLLCTEWIIVQVLLWRFHGVKTIEDSWKYLGQSFFDLWTISGSEKMYAGYVGFLNVCQSAGANLESIVIIQVIISGISTIYLYKTLFFLSKSRLTSVLGTGLFIMFYKLQIWNYFILTDSLFISFTIITFYALLSKSNPLVKILAAAITTIMRPPGIIFFMAVTLFFLYPVFKQTKMVRFKWLLIIVLFTICLGIFNRLLVNFRIVETWNSGKIVFNVDNYEDRRIVEQLMIDNTSIIDCGEESKDNIAIVTLASSIFKNPSFLARLFISKIFYFIFDIRPYYSVLHIIISVSTLLFLYIGIFRYLNSSLDSSLYVFAITYILGTILMAGMTILSWEGRFFAPLYPFLIIFGFTGYTQIIERFAVSSKASLKATGLFRRRIF